MLQNVSVQQASTNGECLVSARILDATTGGRCLKADWDTRLGLARKEIPIKTFADWKDTLPGFLEIDFVVPGGGSMAGEYLHSLVATDVCSGWVEAVPLLAREQTLAGEGLTRIRQQRPVPMCGSDSNNDGAFIHEPVASYCKAEGLAFTRSRPHHKNDPAWIEQKNGAVIRRRVGHERFSGIVAGQALAQLLAVVRLYVNYFQPERCSWDGALHFNVETQRTQSCAEQPPAKATKR